MTLREHLTIAIQIADRHKTTHEHLQGACQTCEDKRFDEEITNEKEIYED
jgi:hypothetical protein